MDSENIKIIDCTIRDGGHLNNWQFDSSCVKASYYAAAKSGVDYFEIGYRFPENKKGLGAFGYCEDNFLNSLFELDSNCKLILMIDAGKSAEISFNSIINTPVSGVRVASYPYEFPIAIKLVEKLKNKGYEVFLNLMASSEITSEQFDILGKWQEKNILEAVTFADSFGSFIPKDIPDIVKRIKTLGFSNVGFHSHNNLQMAFANSLRAVEEGVTYLDASILGMGRGAGNLPIEILLGYLEKSSNTKYNVVPYLDIIDRYYTDLYKDLNWGYKLKSLLSGLRNLHPYYIDELFRRKSYTIPEIWNAADFIKDNCPTSFSIDKLNESLEQRFYCPLTKEKANQLLNTVSDQFKIIPSEDSFDAHDLNLVNKHKNEKILIIANGPSIIKYENEIKNLIREKNLITIGVNLLPQQFVPDYHIFVSRKRLLKYIDKIHPDSKLLVPSFFGRKLIKENYNGNVTFFNIETVNDKNESVIEGANQKCVHLNVSISAILMAYLMGSSEIYSVGIDGYVDEMSSKMVFFYNEDETPDDKKIASLRYEMFSEELDRTYNFLQEKSVSFSIITPTSHKKYYKNIF